MGKFFHLFRWSDKRGQLSLFLQKLFIHKYLGRKYKLKQNEIGRNIKKYMLMRFRLANLFIII